MIDAITLEDIQNSIAERRGPNRLAILLFCRYRADKSSLTWQTAANYINYNQAAGPDLDIYVPGFSFYGVSQKAGLGEATVLENAEPYGFYYPQVIAETEKFLVSKMRDFKFGSPVVAVAIEVESGLPDWENAAVLNLSNHSAEEAERQLLTMIANSQKAQGRTDPCTFDFRRKFRLNHFVAYMKESGWTAASAFTGIGALVLSIASL